MLFAHEGHAPLPTRGAQVDIEKGYLVLTADARAAIDLETAEVELRQIEERILAYATVVAPWRNHAYATSRLTGRIVGVSVVPGQSVKAGEIIAEVESVELDALQLDLLAARNEIALSEKLVAELTRSVDAGAVAGQTVLDAERGWPRIATPWSWPEASGTVSACPPLASMDSSRRQAACRADSAGCSPRLRHRRPCRTDGREGDRTERAPGRNHRPLDGVGPDRGAREGPSSY